MTLDKYGYPVINSNKRRNILLIIAFGFTMMAIGFHYGQWSLQRKYDAPWDALGVSAPAMSAAPAPMTIEKPKPVIKQVITKLAKEIDC